MIPFTQPKDGVIINLSQIVAVIDHPAGKSCPLSVYCDGHDEAGDTITVYFSDGSTKDYDDEAAKIVKGGVLMNREIYEKGMIAMLKPSNIVTPTGGRIQ